MRHALPLFSLLVFVATPCVVAAQPPGRGGGGQQGRGGPPTEMIIQLFTQADVNNDGAVTKAELTAAMSSGRAGNRQGRGGPPNGRPPREEGNQQQGPQGQHGPPPRPGEVLPSVVLDTLNLNDKQKRQLTALQTEVDQRLATILTVEQKQLLENHRPPGGEHGGPGAGGPAQDRQGGANGRPQRPQ